MKKSFLLSIKSARSILKLIVLYSTLKRTEVTALYNDVKREENLARLVDPCSWKGDCKIDCVSDGSFYNASENVGRLYPTRPQCHLNGIGLTLNRVGINGFSGDFWFSANINITVLELDLSRAYEIQQGRFRADVFRRVEELTLKYFQPYEFKSFTFTGLESLRTLKISGVQFDNSSIEIGVLEYLRDTLREFHLLEANKKNKAISIGNFFGENSAILSNLEYVKIRYNLSDINHLSFTSIPNITKLDLAECQITNIGDFTFSHSYEKLQFLNLASNMLVTLPLGIFTSLNLTPISNEPFLKIHLIENPWDCDCGNEYLRQILVDYSNFDGAALCPNPVTQCPDPTITDTPNTTYPTTTPPPTTTPATTPTTAQPTTPATTPTTPQTTTPTTAQPTTPTTTQPTIPMPTGVKQCFSSTDYKEKKTVVIKNRVYQIHMTLTSDVISVSIEGNESNVALIWFGTERIPNDFSDYHHQSPVIGCDNASRKEIQFKQIDRETAYTICLINMVDTTISPLDCISYYHNGAEINGVWLIQSNKVLVIGAMIGSLLISTIVGMMIGAIFFRMKLHRSNNNTVTIQTIINPISVIDLNDPGVSEELPVNDNESELDSSDNPPPLPPHPKFIDDNYYETIEY